MCSLLPSLILTQGVSQGQNTLTQTVPSRLLCFCLAPLPFAALTQSPQCVRVCVCPSVPDHSTVRLRDTETKEASLKLGQLRKVTKMVIEKSEL